MQTKLVRIPLGAIRVTNLRTSWRSQRRCDDRAVADMLRHVTARGWVQAVTVRPLTEGDYELIDGERRIVVARQTGQTEIDAIVVDVDDATAAAIALLANVGSRKLRAFERALLYSQIGASLARVEGKPATQAEIAEWVGLAQPTVQPYLAIARAFPKTFLRRAGASIDDLVPLPSSLLERAAKLAPGERRKWLTELVAGVRSDPEVTTSGSVRDAAAEAGRRLHGVSVGALAKAGPAPPMVAWHMLAQLAPLIGLLAWQVVTGTAKNAATTAATGLSAAGNYRIPIIARFRRLAAGVRRWASRVIATAGRWLRLILFLAIVTAQGIQRPVCRRANLQSSWLLASVAWRHTPSPPRPVQGYENPARAPPCFSVPGRAG